MTGNKHEVISDNESPEAIHARLAQQYGLNPTCTTDELFVAIAESDRLELIARYNLDPATTREAAKAYEREFARLKLAEDLGLDPNDPKNTLPVMSRKLIMGLVGRE